MCEKDNEKLPFLAFDPFRLRLGCRRIAMMEQPNERHVRDAVANHISDRKRHV